MKDSDLERILGDPARSCAGRSIKEILEGELDDIIERMMTGQAADDDKGKAQGVAYCIAVFTNPYSPNVPAIKNEAMLRWEDKQEEEDSEGTDTA